MGERGQARACGGLAARVVVASLALLMAAMPLPARGEGEHWGPLYNKLARMLNERCRAAGVSEVALLPPAATVSQGELQLLRSSILLLAERYYVAADAEHHGASTIPRLIVRLADRAGEPIPDAFSNPRLQQPSLFRLAGLPNDHAFTRMPAEYGVERYANDFSDGPVLWEHFQELLATLQVLRVTATRGAWTSLGEAHCRRVEEFGEGWPALLEALAVRYPTIAPVDTTPTLDGLQPPQALFDAFSSNYTSMIPNCWGTAWRSHAYFRVTGLPPELPHTVRFFVLATAGPAVNGGVMQWDANGDPVLQDRWAEWATATEACGTEVLSPQPLGDPTLAQPAPPAEFDCTGAPPDTALWGWRGWRTADACALVSWRFTAWADLEPRSIQTTDFMPPGDAAADGLLADCTTCDEQTCALTTSLSEHPGGTSHTRITLGRSDARAGVTIAATLSSGGTVLPHSGLAAGSPPAGTLLHFSLDTRIESDTAEHGHRWVNVLRPAGRVVTFHFAPGATYGLPVGCDRGNAGEYLLADRGADGLELLFADGAGHGYAMPGGHLQRAGRTGRDGHGEQLVRGADGWPGLTWSEPLAELLSPRHRVSVGRDAADAVCELRYATLDGDVGEPLARVEVATAADGVPARLTRSLFVDDAWQVVEDVALGRDPAGTQALRRGSLTVERRDVPGPGDNDRTVVLSRRRGNGQSRTESIVWHRFPWGWAKVSESRSDPAEASTLYSYIEDPAAGPAYGRLRQTLHTDGGWERREYDAEGRLCKIVRPFLDTPPDAPEAEARVTRLSYAAAPGEGPAPFVPHCTVEVVLNRVVARQYVLVSEQETRVVRCLTLGSDSDAPDALRTTVTRDSDGEFAGRPRYEQHPDGTLTVYEYAREGDALRTTVTHGAPAPDRQEVLDGTRTVTLTDAAGREWLRETSDVRSGVVLARTAWSEPDRFGRFTMRRDLGGRETRTAHGCCGPDTVTDPEGRTTRYTYNEDGETASIATSDGITRRFEYDTDGAVTREVREGRDGSRMTLRTARYDATGRCVGETDAAGGETRHEFAKTETGRTVHTTVFPDGGTRVHTTARDGTLLSVSGTAVAPVRYEYGVAAEGAFVRDIRPGADGSDTEWVRHRFDLLGRHVRTEFPDGAATVRLYNPRGQLAAEHDPDGVTRLYEYNARGELACQAVDMDRNGKIDRAGADRITCVVRDCADDPARGSLRRTLTWVWPTVGIDRAELAEATEERPGAEERWVTRFGRTEHTVTDRNGHGGRTVTTTAADGTRRIREYQDERLMRETTVAADGTRVQGWACTYDAHGRRIEICDDAGRTVHLAYDDADRVVTATGPDPDDAGPRQGESTTCVYDARGRPVHIGLPDGGVLHREYGSDGRLRRAWGAHEYPVALDYDGQGRLTTLTTWQQCDPDSGSGLGGAAVTRWHYDPARGWPVAKEYPDGRGPAWRYTAGGRLALRRWARTTMPAAGGDPLPIETTYTYNAAGNLERRAYIDSTPPITYVYDRLGRTVREETTGVATLDLTHRPDGAPATERLTLADGTVWEFTREWDALGRPVGFALHAGPDGVAAVRYGFDPAGRLASVSAGAQQFVYGYGADEPARVTRLLGWRGTQKNLDVAREFDASGRLLRVSTATGDGTVQDAWEYAHDGAGRRNRATMADGSHWAYAYDQFGQIEAASRRWADGQPVPGMQFSYGHDHVGNRRITARGSTDTTGAWTVNHLNQYTEREVPGWLDLFGEAPAAATVTVNGLPTARRGEFFHRRLPADNRASPAWEPLHVVGVRNLAGPAGEDLVAEEAGHLFLPRTPERFLYDADGNLVEDGRWRYGWDAENRLVAAETLPAAATAGVPSRRVEFLYDSRGRRVARRVYGRAGPDAPWALVTTSVFAHDGWNLVAERVTRPDAPAPEWHTWTWGLDLSGTLGGAGGVGGLLAAAHGVGAPGQAAVTELFGYDGNGNVSVLLDAATGAEAARYLYDPFGGLLARSGPAAATNPWRFSTKPVDPDTGLYFYGCRWYTPGLGRWLSRDPLEEAGGLNVYGFVGNDPVNAVDPLGLTSLRPWHGDFFVYEGAVGVAGGLWDVTQATTSITLGILGVFADPLSVFGGSLRNDLISWPLQWLLNQTSLARDVPFTPNPFPRGSDLVNLQPDGSMRGFSLPGDGAAFAGQGARRDTRWGTRPLNMWDLAAKIHDLNYHLNGSSFSVLRALTVNVSTDRRARSRKAKADHIFRKMTMFTHHNPGSFGYGVLANVFFTGSVSRLDFVSGDCFDNALVRTELDNRYEYLMIPLSVISEAETASVQDACNSALPTDENPGWSRWKMSHVPFWNELSAIDASTGPR